MISILPYLVKLSISLAVVFLFYRLVLHRLTFYNWNRWYLVIYSLLSFFIPFINIYPLLQQNNWSSYEVLEYIPIVGSQQILLQGNSNKITWTYREWAVLLIVVGIGIMLLRLMIQQLSFLKLRRSAKLIIDDTVRVYQVDKNIIPFSYGNSIFVNQHQHADEELKEIIRHEFIHVKQKHTLDILWCEWLCILNWYNPFAWMLRQSVRQNLEFIADNKVLANGIDKKEYQFLLLKVIGVAHFSIAPQFNFSSLKKRIIMMNKMKTAKMQAIKFLFILPLVVVLLVAFRPAIQEVPLPARSGNSPAGKASNEPIPDTLYWVGEKIFMNKLNANGLVASAIDTVPLWGKLPDHVNQISIKNNLARVKLKNGTVESYNLLNKVEKEAFIKAYGEIPTTPPPPPPPSSKWVPSPRESAPVSPPSPIAPLPVTPPPPPPIPVKRKYNSKGYVITVADNQGECIVIVKNKEAKIIKAVALTEWNKNESENIANYGDIPSPIKDPGNSDLNPKTVTGFKKQSATGVMEVEVHGYPLNGSGKGNSISPNHDMLYVIDGIQQPKGADAIKQLDVDDIEGISILKDESAIALYGVKGSKGVVSITTKKNKGGINFESNNLNNDNEKIVLNGNVKLSNMDNFNGLFVVDGKEYTKKEFMGLSLESITIESVTVLKGSSATNLYGDKGKEGVIQIKTKRLVTSLNQQKNSFIVTTKKLTYKARTNTLLFEGDVLMEDGTKSTISCKAVLLDLDESNSLLLVDGYEKSLKEDFVINNRRYKIVSLPKNVAIEKYGTKGENGAVEITSL